jgi:glycosyltransferase involved in cell wall biosynthesis
MSSEAEASTEVAPAAIPLVRIIAKLNVGGATIQAISLTRWLEPRYETTLVKGVEAPDEGNMYDLAEALGVHPLMVPSLHREPGPRDLLALGAVWRILRRTRPAVLHTHTAKAGTVGRVAAILAGRSRPPVIVHTFHGHVLEGYFSPLRSRFYQLIERILARFTTRLIAVSEEVKQDLIRLRVARADRIEVVPLGLDLEPLAQTTEATRARLRTSVRAELDIPLDRKVVSFVGRVAPIKRVDRLLAVAQRLREREDLHLLIVGDGALRAELEASEPARALQGRITWAGFRRDLPGIYAASDLVVLTSDNEGTPVSLIEAQSFGLPVVTTNVGGTRAVVEDGVSGRILKPGDDRGMAAAIAEILDDPELAARFADAGRSSALSRFALPRLVRDLDALYTRLLKEQGTPVTELSAPELAGGDAG